MTSPSLSQQCLQAAKIMTQPSLVSQWTLRITYIAALFAGLQAVSSITVAPSAFVWLNLCICLWLFNMLCVQTQHDYLSVKAKDASSNESFGSCAFPLVWAAIFFVLFACFVLLDYIPYLGTGLSIILTPIFFLIAAIPPLGVVIQLLLPVFVFPYIKSSPQSSSSSLMLSFLQFVQQPARTVGFFFLSYAPLIFTALLLLGSWMTVFMMNRFSDNWSVALLQKSLLIILSGLCLGPATLFLAIMGVLPASQNTPGRRFKNQEKERQQWFMRGEEG